MNKPETCIATLSIKLFGPMQVLVQGQPLAPLRSRRGLWLLALLTLRSNRPVEREWLAGTLWPEIDQSQAFDNLRPILSGLRSALGSEGERVQSPTRRTLFLDLAGAEADVCAFDAATASKDLSALERAVALYRGPLLEGCNEDWVFQERAVREQCCLGALQTLGDAALADREYGRAIDFYQRAVGIDPWWESARRGWMEALAGSGDTNEALQVYRDFVNVLRSDPKATPDEQTSALYDRLRSEARERVGTHAVVRAYASTGDQAATPPAVQGYLPHPLTELIGREDERMELTARLRRSRLVTLVGFGGIGKTRLSIEIASSVVREYPDGVWLISLEAIADGKRVTRQIATVMGLREEQGGNLLQSLTDHLRKKRALLVLDNCEHVLEASAQAASHLLAECGGVHILATSREPMGVAGETAWPVPTLATPDPSHLPQGHSTLLRVLMGYESVQLFVERAQSVQKSFELTVGNARAVAAICAYLEGIPLAIELAAARVRTLTVDQLAARLDDHLGLLSGRSTAGSARQQTLRATLDWSNALLSEAERALLMRLSVFSGGCSLDAAEAVCGGLWLRDQGQEAHSSTTDNQRSTTNAQPSTINHQLSTPDVLDLLTSLVDKSLVVFEAREADGRYRLLEMVRQYAGEKLKLIGEMDRVRARHRDYYLALAEEGEPELMGANQGLWLERLELERANLRSAIDWCGLQEDGAQAGLRLAGALYRFWELHGLYTEGRAYLSAALSRDTAGSRTLERARALKGAGVLAYYQGDHSVSTNLLEEGLAIFRELNDLHGVAWSLNDLADVAGAQGDREASRARYEESLGIFKRLGDRHGTASVLHHLGRVVREQGDYPVSRAIYEESLAIFRELGNRQGTAWALHHLGHVAGSLGDHSSAWSFQEEGLTIFRELGNLQGEAWALNELGGVAAARGDGDTSRAMNEESLTIFRKLGNRQGTASLLSQLGRMALDHGDARGARAYFEESLAIFRELGNRQGVASSLNGLGRVACEQDQYPTARVLYSEGLALLKALGDRRGTAEGLDGLALALLELGDASGALRLWGAVDALWDGMVASRPSHDWDSYERLIARARLAVADPQSEWAHGRSLTWEQAVDYALQAGVE